MDLSHLTKIAFCGKANTGKNTTALMLRDKLCDSPHQARTIAFADPIKQMIEVMFPWADKDCLYGSSKLRANVIPNAFDEEGKPLTYRQLLIDLGSQGRKYNPNHWIDLFDYSLNHPQENVLGTHKAYTTALCTDVRFKNEFDYLRSKGFFIIKIMRESDVIINHSTETNQDTIRLEEFDYVLNNNGTLDDLQKSVNEIVRLVKSNK